MIQKAGVDSTFHDRLMSVLKTEKKKWWEKHLNVSNSLISSRWEKGGMPHLDKIIKICKLKNVSANWLLLGEGPKYLDDTADNQADEAGRRAMQAYIINLERKVRRYEAYIQKIADSEPALQAMVRITKLLETSDETSRAFEALEDVSVETFFEQYILPLQLFVRSFGDIAAKGIEMCLRTEEGKAFALRMFAWIREEQERAAYLYKGRLKELEPLFDNDAFKALLGRD